MANSNPASDGNSTIEFAQVLSAGITDMNDGKKLYDLSRLCDTRVLLPTSTWSPRLLVGLVIGRILEQRP
jgi:hypothetical protein